MYRSCRGTACCTQHIRVHNTTTEIPCPDARVPPWYDDTHTSLMRCPHAMCVVMALAVCSGRLPDKPLATLTILYGCSNRVVTRVTGFTKGSPSTVSVELTLHNVFVRAQSEASKASWLLYMPSRSSLSPCILETAFISEEGTSSVCLLGVLQRTFTQALRFRANMLKRI